MSNAPKISIIVPIYNAEKYIDRCLSSIYSQTFTDYEIILVNDGSTDRSDEICIQYAQRDERIRYIKKANQGAGSARNVGIEVATGEYLAFPDVDDWFEPNMYEELVALTEDGKYDVVFSGVNYYQQQGKDEAVYSRTVVCDTVKFLGQDVCRSNVMKFFPTSTIFDVPWNKLYKRSVAINNHVRFSDTRRCQDAMFNLDFYNAISSAVSVGKAYYNYLENTNIGVQRKFPQNYIDINIEYFRKLICILDSWGMYKDDIKLHYDTSFILAVYETMSMFENPVWNMNRTEKKRYIYDCMDKSYVKDMLQSATVREDVNWIAKMIANRNYYLFLTKYRIEKFKKKLRENRVAVRIYHILKG